MRKIASPLMCFTPALESGVVLLLPDAVADDDDGCKKESIVALEAPIQGNASSASTLQVCAPGCTRKSWSTSCVPPSGFSTGTTLPNVPLPIMCSGRRRSSRPV